MTVITERRALTAKEEFDLVDAGWTPVGMSLWYHPNAPKQLYFNTEQALDVIDKFDSVESSEIELELYRLTAEVDKLLMRIRSLRKEISTVLSRP